MDHSTTGHVERQRMLGALPWAILGAVDLVMLAICYAQVVLGVDLGGRPIGDDALIAITCAVILVPIATFAPLVMVTRVTPYAVEVRFEPYRITRTMPFTDISSVDVVTIRPFAQFGGYGIRYARGVRAYNPSSRSGVRIGLEGRDLVIGSTDPHSLRHEILSAMGKMDTDV